MSTAFAPTAPSLERHKAPLEEAEAWEALQTHLEWSVGPTLAFLFADDLALIQRLRERATRAVAAHGGRFEILKPDDPQALRGILRELLGLRGLDLIWLEAASSEPGWAEAWSDLLVRLNQRREQLRKNLGGLLVIVAPRASKPRIRAIAPDLWSIHTMAHEVVPAPRAPDRRACRRNVQPISEGIEKTLYHLGMRGEQPWFALVTSEDPLPRRRMREALGAQGLSVVVHPPTGGWAPLSRPIQADLHWVAVQEPLPQELLRILAGRPAPSKPVFLEGTPALLAHLKERHPELYRTMAFSVRLQDERPLPDLLAEEPPWDPLDGEKAPEDELHSLIGEDEALVRTSRVRHRIQAADALLDRGWASQAAPLAREALEAAQALSPTDPEADWLCAEARELMGRVAQKLGQPDALRWYRLALDLRRRLARTRGRHKLRRRAELARCLSRMGELALRAGEEREAAPLLRNALAIRQRLARASDDRETLLDLAMAWSLKGDLELALGRAGDRSLTAATEAYREALRLRRQVASEEGSPQLQRLLSISHGRLADALGRAGDWKGARREASQALLLARGLLAQQPQHPGLQAEASVAASRLGDCARAQGDLQGAAQAYRAEAELRQALLQEQPENVRLMELCAVAWGRLAETELSLGHPERSLEAASRCLALSERLASLHPEAGHLKRLRELGAAWLRVADALLGQGATEQADEAYARVEEIAARLRDSSEEEDWRASTLLQELEARGRAQEPAEIR